MRPRDPVAKVPPFKGLGRQGVGEIWETLALFCIFLVIFEARTATGTHTTASLHLERNR